MITMMKQHQESNIENDSNNGDGKDGNGDGDGNSNDYGNYCLPTTYVPCTHSQSS